MRYSAIGAVLLCCLVTSLAQDPDVCRDAVVVDGVGYHSNGECDKFIECNYQSGSAPIVWLKQCPFGTYWNMDYLTCTEVDKVRCEADKCRGVPNGEVYAAVNNCKGYWQCEGGKSVAKCCDYGKQFNKDLMECVADELETCADKCFDTHFNWTVNCDKIAISDRPGYYKQMVDGWGLLELPCAPGTGFHQESCHCINLVEVDNTRPKCTPELYLPFTTDHRDQSGKNVYVQNINVDVRDGHAVFNGVNSRLIIPRFTNLEHSTTIVVKIKYESDHKQVMRMSQALVGNNGCGNIPTLLVAEDMRNVYVGVGTDEKMFAYTAVPQMPQNIEKKSFVYTFMNGTLSGALQNPDVNGQIQAESSISAPGYFKNVRCALQIGFADSMEPFRGRIDELSVFLCHPDN